MAKSRNVANLIAANLLPASNTITSSMLVDGLITSGKLAASAVTLPKLDSTVTANFPTTITAVYVTDNAYTVQPDSAISPSGGFIKISGTGFLAGAQVYINNTPASTTVYVSSTEIRAQIPALTAGYYHIYIQNANGQAAIRANGLYVSAAPVWITGSSLGGGNNIPFGIQLSATSDTSVTYSVAVGSSLPSGVALTSLGYLSGTVSGLSTTTVYSVDIIATDSETQQTTRTFTLTISVSEPYFNQNSLLLQGNYTNAVANNNTFLDTSQTAAGITKTGNVAQGSFGAFSQTGWSNYFDGSGDYLVAPAGTAIMGTDDFTIELWAYHTASGAWTGYYYQGESGGGGGINFRKNNADQLSFSHDGVQDVVTSTATIPINQWVHIAVTRSSGTVRLFINGTVVGTTTYTANFTGSSGQQTIGSITSGLYYMAGYISNFRALKGTAVYTGAFTPPTAPLTAVTNTQLLTCQSNRFVDNSTNNFTITRNGDVSIQAFSPFPPANAYLSTLNGGSSYYDGSGDYLTINPSTPMTIGTSDATVEFWMYPTAEDGYRRVVASTAAGFASGSFCIRYNNGNFAAGAAGGNYITYSGYPQLNAWNHVAWVGTGGTSQALYINGVRVGTAGSYNITETIQYLGGYYSTGPAEFYKGYISDFRVMKGTALYSGTFTVPTAPLARAQTTRTNVAITTGSTTSALMNFTNAGIIDATGKNTIESIGAVATQTTYFKYGGASLQFTGTGFLSMPNTPILNLGSGPFTIEAWVYLTAAPGNNVAYTLASNHTGTTNGARYWWLGITTGTAPAGGFVSSGTGSITFATTVYGINNGATWATPTWTYNQWNHVAVTRDTSNNWYIFFNGTSLTTSTGGTWSSSNSFTVTSAASPTMAVGAQPTNPTPSYFVGYVDDLRITTGIARFTANFTPATSDLAVQ